MRINKKRQPANKQSKARNKYKRKKRVFSDDDNS